MLFPQPIPIVFESVVNYVRTEVLAELQDYNPEIQTVQYLYGLYDELLSTLAGYQMDRNLVNQRYPLIWLDTNFEIRRNNDGFFGTASGLRVFIMFHAEPKLLSSERYTQTFGPILYPIYETLLQGISNTPAFNAPYEYGIPHTKKDLERASVNETKESNLVNDYVDAIQITNFDLKVDFGKCITPVPFNN